METRLQLLMDDGPVHLYFRPKLTAEQYGLLLKASEASHTVGDLSSAAKQLADEWGIETAVYLA